MQPYEDQRPAVEAAEPTVLVTARPGRGKTTVALMFARRIIGRQAIGPSQQVLFLTFSRNAVYQIEQTSGRILDATTRSRVRIATYHSFMWWLLQAFGRYNGLPHRLEWMGDTKYWLCRRQAECGQTDRRGLPAYLATTHGAASYSMFAPLALDLLRKSASLRSSLHRLYPVVVVDEFQDTTDEQWEFVKLIADECRLMCLADPDQMIFRGFGASPDRLMQLVAERKATRYEFTTCHRTGDHDLLDFAESILDDKLMTLDAAQRYARRFLRSYDGSRPNALGLWLKPVVAGFLALRPKEGKLKAFPSIAVAAHSNVWARRLRSVLGKSTPKAPKTYRCTLIEGDTDDALESLILDLVAWAGDADEQLLQAAVRLAASMLPESTVTGSASLRRLRDSSYASPDVSEFKGTARDIVETLRGRSKPAVSTPEEALADAVHALHSLRAKSRCFADSVSEEAIDECNGVLSRLLSEARKDQVSGAVVYLRNRLSALRVRQCVLERVQPVRGLVGSTMHKLKGREFDYVCVVTTAGDALQSKGDTERDARRLMYVALTRARHDARILYARDNPCFLLRPYLEVTGQWPQGRPGAEPRRVEA